MSDEAVPQDVLLLGALYALEQCGLLLNDAAALAERRRYPTAAGIALLAREEMGKHRMLLDLWRKSVGGAAITRKEVNTGLDNHKSKQDRANMSLFYRGTRGDQIDQLVQARQNATPGTDDWRTADERLRRINKRRWQRQPGDRVNRRILAFYVDLGPGGWLRPATLTPQVCADDVTDGLNDYRLAKLRVEEAAEVHNDIELADAVRALVGRPTLPEAPLLSIEAALPADQINAGRKGDG
jgi:AbiV family abortive infection protein